MVENLERPNLRYLLITCSFLRGWCPVSIYIFYGVLPYSFILLGSVTWLFLLWIQDTHISIPYKYLQTWRILLTINLSNSTVTLLVSKKRWAITFVNIYHAFAKCKISALDSVLGSSHIFCVQKNWSAKKIELQFFLVLILQKTFINLF